MVEWMRRAQAGASTLAKNYDVVFLRFLPHVLLRPSAGVHRIPVVSLVSRLKYVGLRCRVDLMTAA